MAEICKNNYLTMDEQKQNAEIVYAYLTSKGWTKNSICGMLGNMQTESNINPCLWESMIPFGRGFGLVQWTPYTKYTEWASAQGKEYTSIYTQLDRIEYELANGLQWIQTSSFPMTFAEFKVSTQSPEYLADAFITNYERPADPTQPIRGTQARYWWDNLEGNGEIDPNPPGGGGETPSKDEDIFHLWLGGVLTW